MNASKGLWSPISASEAAATRALADTLVDPSVTPETITHAFTEAEATHGTPVALLVTCATNGLPVHIAQHLPLTPATLEIATVSFLWADQILGNATAQARRVLTHRLADRLTDAIATHLTDGDAEAAEIDPPHLVGASLTRHRTWTADANLLLHAISHAGAPVGGFVTGRRLVHERALIDRMTTLALETNQRLLHHLADTPETLTEEATTWGYVLTAAVLDMAEAGVLDEIPDDSDLSTYDPAPVWSENLADLVRSATTLSIELIRYIRVASRSGQNRHYEGVINQWDRMRGAALQNDALPTGLLDEMAPEVGPGSLHALGSTRPSLVLSTPDSYWFNHRNLSTTAWLDRALHGLGPLTLPRGQVFLTQATEGASRHKMTPALAAHIVDLYLTVGHHTRRDQQRRALLEHVVATDTRQQAISPWVTALVSSLTDSRDLATVAEHPDPRIRRRVATHPHVTLDLLATLSEDPDKVVRRKVTEAMQNAMSAALG